MDSISCKCVGIHTSDGLYQDRQNAFQLEIESDKDLVLPAQEKFIQKIPTKNVTLHDQQ